MAGLSLPGSLNPNRNGDILIAVGAVLIIGMLIVPLPAILLDFLLMVDLIISLLILLMVLSVKSTAEFSVFPMLLLVTTAFRLALNVSSTRLILTQGLSFESQIIRSFANFVVGGNIVIGIIIFAILLIVQFLVITRGAKRVAEVRARFTLDAMNPKMMAIDAQVNSGAISEDEARDMRDAIRKEADFYGSMDGASNFVQGDVIAGLIITFVNVIGGLIIGMAMRGESLSDAAQAYIRFTIGDGLVSQIPALLMSYATGLLIVRSASENHISKDVVQQLFSNSKNLFIASAFAGLMAFIPGFPTFILLIFAGGMFGIGWAIRQQKEEMQVQEGKEAEAAAEEEKGPLRVEGLLTVEPIGLSIGTNLIPLVDEAGGGDLLNRVTNTRRELALNMGMVVPPVRIRDDANIEPEEYGISINGTEMTTGFVRPSMLLALNQTGEVDGLEGERTVEPAFGLPAYWIKYDDRDLAEKKGCMVFSPTAVIATHLTETIRRNAELLLGREEVQSLIDNLRKSHPTLVAEATKGDGALGYIQKVMQSLLREGISIRNSVAILEAISDNMSVMPAEKTAEVVRSKLAHQISKQFSSGDSVIHVINLSSKLQEEIANSISDAGDGRGEIIAMDIESMRGLLSRLKEGVNIVQEKGFDPVVLVSPLVRKALFNFVSKNLPGVNVLATTEVAEGYSLEAVAQV